MRLIDADVLRQDWLFRGDDGKPYRDTVDAQPAIEVRKTGRWVADRYCSECDFDKKEFDYICGWKENYCPNCGAKMEVEHEI